MTQHQHKFLADQFDGQGGSRILDQAHLQHWTEDQGMLWVHLDYTNDDHREWIEQESGLDDIICEALLAEEPRPRVTSIGNGLLIALRGINLSPNAEPEDMVSIRLWVEKNRIISTRKRSLQSILAIRELLKSGNGPQGPADFIVELCDQMVHRMSDTVDNLEDHVAELEDKQLSEDIHPIRFELATLRRKSISLRRYLAPQREALGRLVVEKIDWITDDHRIRLREVSDRLIRHIEDIDAVRERAMVTQEELLSRLSEQMNKRMYVLSIVAAIFLPLGFLTGLLGINVGGIPGADYPPAFWIFIGILIIALSLQLLLFRWKKWL